MKYIVDLDAMKNCIALLPKPFTLDGEECVYLKAVFDMVDAFPKEEVKKNETLLR